MSAEVTTISNNEYARIKINEIVAECRGDQIAATKKAEELAKVDGRFLAGCAERGLNLCIEGAVAVKH